MTAVAVSSKVPVHEGAAVGAMGLHERKTS